MTNPLHNDAARCASMASSAVRRFVRRISIKRFPDSLHISPLLCCDREPGGWGKPGCWWVSFGWLRWAVHVALHDRPCEGCLYWVSSHAVFNEPCTLNEQVLTLAELERALVRHGVIQAAAIEDAEHYDEGRIKESVRKVYEDLTGVNNHEVTNKVIGDVPATVNT